MVLLGLLVVGIVATIVVVESRGRRLSAPAPSGAGPVGTLIDVPSSRIGLQVHFGTSTVTRVLESHIPTRFGSLEQRRSHPQNSRITYAVAGERGDLDVQFLENTVQISTMVQYQGRIWLDSPIGAELATTCRVEPGAAPPRAVVQLAVALEITESWRILSSVQDVVVRPASESPRDRCRVTLGPLQLDVTDRLLALAEEQLREATGDVGDLVAGLDLRSRIETGWARLQEPVQIQEAVWLQLNPDSIFADQVDWTGPDRSTLSADLALLARPRLVVGRRPSVTEAPLPVLSRGQVARHFEALITTRVEHATASERVREVLLDRSFEVVGRSVRISDITVAGASGGRLALEVEVDGALRGRLHLVGTPHLDPGTGEVTVPDLAFSVATRNVLVRGAAWLLRGTFTERIRRFVRWDVDEAVERIRSLTEAQLDRSLGENLTTEGDLTFAQIMGTTVTDEALVIQARLEGTLVILVGERFSPIADRRNP